MLLRLVRRYFLDIFLVTYIEFFRLRNKTEPLRTLAKALWLDALRTPRRSTAVSIGRVRWILWGVPLHFFEQFNVGYQFFALSLQLPNLFFKFALLRLHLPYDLFLSDALCSILLTLVALLLWRRLRIFYQPIRNLFLLSFYPKSYWYFKRRPDVLVQEQARYFFIRP